ncbi:hypothetical protein LOK49_LG09G00491 [Camellia lanceoleosa]|uniref:Uncharacterized protein n=1 Tax=Camellia lanceoleosa TaxID=1840588 RepID=A0ACC0GHQ4_9ERIC|nr:hypothetical protein LOK49_LG09G00491 [Camellia lanceoleosa]
MLLRAASAFCVLNNHGDNPSPFVSPALSSSLNSAAFVLGVSQLKSQDGFVVCASKGSNSRRLTGVVFDPFEEGPRLVGATSVAFSVGVLLLEYFGVRMVEYFAFVLQ